MTATVFGELRFWLLVLFSVVIPFGIYWLLMAKRAISRGTVLLLGFALVAISGLDVYLLQSLSNLAKRSISLADDAVFLSEVSVGLYLLPAMFGGIGINVVSHVLVSHLVEAEARLKTKAHDA